MTKQEFKNLPVYKYRLVKKAPAGPFLTPLFSKQKLLIDFIKNSNGLLILGRQTF